MRGDYRALFLGWLADFDPEEWQDLKDGEVLMPPIPTGLNHLSPALTKLIEHFPVDPDALAVAARLSQASTLERIPVAAVLERLSMSELRAMLARVAKGGGSGVMAELNRLTYPRVQIPVGPAMRCTDFAAKTIETREARLKKEAAAEAAKREREAQQRKQHLCLNVRLPIAFDRSGHMEVDFLCADLGIVIELDGEQHLADEDAYRRDRHKDTLLQQHGYFVLRFLACDVAKRLEHVLDGLLAVIQSQRNRQPGMTNQV